MIEFLSSVILLLIVLVLTVWEKRYYNCLFTPFNVTAWPFVIISVVVNLFAVRIKFLPVSVRVNFFILVNLIIIWVVGYLIYHFNKVPLQRIDVYAIFSPLKIFRPFLIVLSWIVIVLVGMRVSSILSKEGLTFIGTAKFEKMMIVGYAAHLSQLAKVLLILLVLFIWNSRKTILDYITIFALALVVLSLMVKYHLIWVILIIFFIKNLHLSYKKQLKKIQIISFMVVVIFILNYLILIFSWRTFSATNPKMWNFIFSLLLNYLMSGPIVLDRWLDLAYTKPWWSLFIVPMNMINVVVGDPERLNAVRFVSVGWLRVAPELYSNVGTSFGVYYIIGGLPLTFLSTIVISFISYLLFTWSYKTKDAIIIFLNVLFLTMGILSFFVQYFTLLSLYEITFFYIILICFFKFILKVKSLNNAM